MEKVGKQPAVTTTIYFFTVGINKLLQWSSGKLPVMEELGVSNYYVDSGIYQISDNAKKKKKSKMLILHIFFYT